MRDGFGAGVIVVSCSGITMRAPFCASCRARTCCSSARRRALRRGTGDVGLAMATAWGGAACARPLCPLSAILLYRDVHEFVRAGTGRRRRGARDLPRRRHSGRMGEAIASVVADRGIGLLALFWLAAVIAMTLNHGTLAPKVIHTRRRDGRAFAADLCGAARCANCSSDAAADPPRARNHDAISS